MHDGVDIFFSIVGAIIVVAALTAASMTACSRNYRQEAIEHGYAYHNPETGIWEWKEKGNDAD